MSSLMTYRKCVWVVSRSHRSNIARILNGLVNQFQHADVSVVVVGMNEVRHPLEEFECALKLIVHVKAGGWRVLAYN